MLRIGQVESTATSGGQYTDGNFAGGIAATRLRAAAFNAIQEELANIVESAGITLSPDDSTQVLAALNKQFQASDKTLTALAGLLTGANKLPYFTGNYTAGQTDLTQVGRDIIGKDTVPAVLEYLGLHKTGVSTVTSSSQFIVPDGVTELCISAVAGGGGGGGGGGSVNLTGTGAGGQGAEQVSMSLKENLKLHLAPQFPSLLVLGELAGLRGRHQ
ncbi:hypothetical protein [Edwardsiella tarda]|uniref:hypothetical protein n=1 Tax=Edwardsiella tarda TaxID=636 RepID=UPI00351C6041